MADLQSSHFGFTDMKKGLFRTDYEDKFKSMRGDPAVMDEARKAYLQSSHFKMGQSSLNYKTEQVNQYQDRGGEPAALDPEMQKDLRNHHFEVKDRESVNKVKKVTDYRDNYTWRVNLEKPKNKN